MRSEGSLSNVLANKLLNKVTTICNAYPSLLHVTREFHSVKLICRNLYAIFLHVKKAYTANQNGV